MSDTASNLPASLVADTTKKAAEAKDKLSKLEAIQVALKNAGQDTTQIDGLLKTARFMVEAIEAAASQLKG